MYQNIYDKNNIIYRFMYIFNIKYFFLRENHENLERNAKKTMNFSEMLFRTKSSENKNAFFFYYS